MINSLFQIVPCGTWEG